MAKILVIEDSADVREMISIVLKSYGYDVAGTAIKDNVPSLIAQFDPHLVLLDLWVVYKYEIDVCTDIKNVHRNLPVILMSDDKYLLAAYKDRCGDDFIEKPFDTMDLKNKIDKLLKGSSIL